MTTQEAAKTYVPEIVACLRPLDPDRVILFGSGARDDRPEAEISDIDLIVVTKAEDMPQSYQEREAVYLAVARALRDIRRRIPLDLIVHTRPMHAKFRQLDSQFARHVLEEGSVIYESDPA